MTYTFRGVDGDHLIEIGSRKLDTFGFELIVDFTNARECSLSTESVGPGLNNRNGLA